jgi:hypothetical protein
MSCAETPAGKEKAEGGEVKEDVQRPGGKRKLIGGKDKKALEPEGEDVLALDVGKDEVELVEEVDQEEVEEDPGDGDWAEEERKLREQNKKVEEENRKKNSRMSMKDKVGLLDNLLQKAAAYTAFLRERMKVST